MQKKIQYSLIIFVLGFVLVCSLIVMRRYQDIDIKLNEKIVTSDYNTGWRVLETDEEITLPIRLQVMEGEAYCITNYLPEEVNENDYLCIRTMNQKLWIYVDGVLIHKNRLVEDETMLTGTFWEKVKIPSNYAGKQIYVVLQAINHRTDGSIATIQLGNLKEIRYDIISDNSLRVILFILLISCGSLGCMIGWRIKVKSELRYAKRVIYNSLFFIILAVWLIGESKIIQLYMNNYYIITQLPFLAVMFLPLPIILLLKAMYEHSGYYKRLDGMYLLLLSNIVGQCSMVAIAGRSFVEFISISHLTIVCTAAVWSSIIVEEYWKKQKKEALKEIKHLVLLASFFIVECIRYQKEGNLEVGEYTSICSMFLIGGLLYYGYRWALRLIAQNQKMPYYERMAYTDELTKAKNRAAYEFTMAKFFKFVDENSQLRLILFDLNDLKQINDQFGHACGDEALVHAFHCIEEAFGKHGTCYRIGGDEFACILTGRKVQEYETCLQELRIAIECVGSNTEYPFNIAVGYSNYHVGDKVGKDIYCRADQAMYRNKKKLKIELG